LDDAEYDDSFWQTGPGGFGFAMAMIIPYLMFHKTSVYTRIKFNITDTAAIMSGILHVDFDDGFVAYLNGEEIARSNISNQPTWDSFADGAIEALMYQGQLPTAFPLDMEQLRHLWKQGENVLAVECHNTSANSSDMSLRVFLSFGLHGTTSQLGQRPIGLI
jgi:hypothetical protein